MNPEKEEQEDYDKSSTSTTKTTAATASKTDISEKDKSEGGFKDDLNSDDNHKNNKKKDGRNSGNRAADENKDEASNEDDDNDLPQSEIEVSSLPSPLFDLDDEAKEELADLSMMLHSSAPFAPHHHHHHAHPHHARAGAAAGGVGGVQNYGGVNSAFHRQPSSGGFHHGHHQVKQNFYLFNFLIYF